MRSVFQKLSLSLLALSLVPCSFAQNTSSTTQDSAGTAQDAPVNTKPDKNAPSPATLADMNAIGNRNVGCNKGMGNWYSLDKQVAMGHQYAAQIEHSAKLVID